VAGITWIELRELAGFRTQHGCAISLYVNLDPRAAPTAAALETRVNSQLDEARRLAEERRAALSHAERAGLRADVERIRGWFEDGFERDGVRGVALFAASLDNFWSVVSLPRAVEDDVTIGGELHLAPLVAHADRDGALVAVVGRERGQIYGLLDDGLVAIADETDEVPGRHDQGGWSQARYERHIENIVGQHLREVAEALDSCARRRRGLPIVLVGAEEIRSEFEELLAKETLACVAGWTTVEAHADAGQILAAATPVLERWCAAREEGVLDRWREEAGRNGRAAAGWEETLEAASDGRVELLLVQAGVDRTAYQCPKCGRVQMHEGGCPLDGTTLEHRDDGVDLAVHQTLTYGGTVHVVRDRRDLEPVGGVAALLRF
jgi:peptide chain release factor subunit 1